MKFASLFISSFFMMLSPCGAGELTLMSFNLHGLHPMNAERRVIVRSHPKPDEKPREIGDSDIFTFNKSEIKLGLEARQTSLATDLSALQPDLLFLQEVGGGAIESVKSCNDFNQWNTALDLLKRLPPDYHAWNACRGNIGWWTDAHTFQGLQVYSENSQQWITGEGQNPYPNGMIIEGLAILTSSRVRVIEQKAEWIPFASQAGKFFVQALRFQLNSPNDPRYFIAVNIHGLRKINHFEGAVATRVWLSRWIAGTPNPKDFAGEIVMGDFNAYTPDQEVSTTPWSDGLTTSNASEVSSKLMTLNRDTRYEPEANLPFDQAQKRVGSAMLQYQAWKKMQRSPNDQGLREVFAMTACSTQAVATVQSVNPLCSWKERIDQAYLSPSLQALSYTGLYSQNNWSDLKNTRSDHPGLLIKIKL